MLTLWMLLKRTGWVTLLTDVIVQILTRVRMKLNMFGIFGADKAYSNSNKAVETAGFRMT